ncbi:MAG: prephenate dehydrogenase [Bacillota bacterium]|nr:prephenate dehydrogenase [Bacillota bacterium]
MGFSDFNITIVGLGLIGGSFAKAINKLNPKNIWAIDRDNNVLLKAAEDGVITGGFTSPQEVLSKSDIVILALYPKDTINFVLENMAHFKSRCLITDTCGIKKDIVSIINGAIRKDLEFIGGHPMAGKEASGFGSADGTLFNNANYFITPTGCSTEKNIDILTNLASEIGCKRVISVTPEEHDSIIAYTSHLPHILAVSLMNCLNTSGDLNCLIGGSFKDATRVANINSDLWVELIKSNKENVLNTLDNFVSHLSSLRSAVFREDESTLWEEFNRSKQKRREIE